MKTVALISGGKDSCYNMMQCVREGHNIVALANLRPKDKDEIDSYMYQTVGHHAIDLYAEAMELPLYRRTIVGRSVSQGKVYEMTATDEVEDLYLLLKQVKEQEHIDAVSVGAILSDYQRVRVEHVCQRLNLIVLAYLWRRDQAELLQEMIECDVKAIIIKVAALGLDPKKHLGMTLKEIYPHMIKMHSEYGLNVCGEGGEYETFTLDCPLFKKRIVVDETVMVMHSDDAFAAVAFLNFSKMHLESKPDFVFTSQKDLVKNLPMKHSGQLLYEVMHSTDVTPSVGQQETSHIPLRSTSKVCSQKAHTYLSKKYINISGVVALKSDTESIDFDISTAMEQLKDILAQYQKSSTDILAVQLCLQDMSKFSHVNNVYRKYFDLNPPIRVCVESSLPENVVLQLDCVCNLTHPQLEVNTMHVQSLSHWAPANIGPYSQAKKICSEVFIAGQIALCPANLNIIEGGLVPQTRLSLRHVRRILSAMTAGSGLHDVVTAICYVTNQEAINSVKEQLKIVYEQQLQDPDTRSLALFDVLYVVVRSLPKAALVEWQVFAVTNRNGDWQEWSSCEKNENYTSHLSMHATEKDGDHILSFIINVELTNDCCCSIKVEDVLCLVLDSVCKILKRVSENAAPLKVLRMFYRADLFTADEVSQAFYSKIGEYFQWLEGNLPGATFIPVLAFCSNTTLFSVYH